MVVCNIYSVSPSGGRIGTGEVFYVGAVWNDQITQTTVHFWWELEFMLQIHTS